MSLISQFNAYINEQHLFEKKDKLLLAVSGGVDSVVLCELCSQSGYDFVIAHCNFQLRGKESNEDEIFVQSLARKYNVDIKSTRFDTEDYAEKNKLNIQIAARELRYNFFNKILTEDNSLKHIVTAHHANDNAETVLMNFLKGTGINGLQGILPKDSGIGGKVVRPLLFSKKDILIAFANEKQLQWREDQSNETNKYTRNFFRNELIPSIEKVMPQLEDNLLENIQRFKEVNLLYEIAVETILKKLVEKKGKELHIPVLKLLKTPALSTVLYELLKSYSFSSQQIPEVIKLLQAESGKYISSSTHRLIKNRQWVILSPVLDRFSNHFIIEQNEKEIHFDDMKISIQQSEPPFNINKDQYCAQIDASTVSFPLILRKWKQGDYFYPLGMDKKKKLSRFFIDNKLSLLDKENCWVLESDKKIIWVVGQRMDNRCKINPSTKLAIVFTLSSSK